MCVSERVSDGRGLSCSLFHAAGTAAAAPGLLPSAPPSRAGSPGRTALGVRCRFEGAGSGEGAFPSGFFPSFLVGDLPSQAAPVCLRHGRGLFGRRHSHHGADHHEGGPWGRGPGPGPRVGGQRGAGTSLLSPPRSRPRFPQALKWHLSPLTIVSWLNVYMQVAYLNDLYEVLLPQYPQQVFIQIVEVSAGPGGPAPPPAGGSPGGCRRPLSTPFPPTAPGPLRPGRRLLRVFLRRAGRLCAVPLLLVRADAEGLR